MKNLEYFLGIYKQRGNVVPINWGALYNPGTYDSSDVQDIDRFTSERFQNEQELKEFLVKHADKIGLKEVAVRDELVEILTDYVRRVLNSEYLRGNIEIRSTLLSIADEIALSNSQKYLFKAIYEEGSMLSRNSEVEAEIKRSIIAKVENSQLFSRRQQEFIIDEIEETNLTAEEKNKLSEYLEKRHATYEIEKTYPLEVMRKEKKPKSEKYSLNKLPNGVVYADDGIFLNVGVLKKILTEAVIRPKPEFLYTLFSKVNPTYQVANMADVKHHLENVKAGKDIPQALSHALCAIELFVDYEVYVYNQKTNRVVKNPDGTMKMNYLGLRKLALLVSKLYKANYQLEGPTLDERVEQIARNTGQSYTYTRNFFDDRNLRNND